MLIRSCRWSQRHYCRNKGHYRAAKLTSVHVDFYMIHHPFSFQNELAVGRTPRDRETNIEFFTVIIHAS